MSRGRVLLPRNPLCGKDRAAGRARTDTAGITTPDARHYITAAKRNGRRDRLPATGGRDVTVRWLRSQLLPIGAPASACPRRHPLTGRPWGLVGASCTLGPALCPALVPSLPRPARRRVDPVDGAGGIRTHGLELMRLARTALCSSAELRGDRRHSVSDFSRTPALPSPIDDRGIEPRSTASSERRLPSRPVVDACSQAGLREAESRARIPAFGGEVPEGVGLQGSARRTRVTGVRDRHPVRLDDRGVARTEGVEPSRLGIGDRVDAVSRPCGAPRAGFEPRILRFRAEDPAVRRPRNGSCDGWGRTSVPRVTAGRPAD